MHIILSIMFVSPHLFNYVLKNTYFDEIRRYAKNEQLLLFSICLCISSHRSLPISTTLPIPDNFYTNIKTYSYYPITATYTSFFRERASFAPLGFLLGGTSITSSHSHPRAPEPMQGNGQRENAQ